LHGEHVVANEDDGASGIGDRPHLPKATFLEFGIANGQHFIHHEDVRLQVRGDRETQTHFHATAVSLDRCIDVVFDAAEGDDLVQLGIDLRTAHAHDGPVEVDVLHAGEFRMEAGAYFQQTGYAALHVNATRGRQGDAREQLQDRALACTVPTDQAQYFALRHIERHIPKCPELVALALVSSLRTGIARVGLASGPGHERVEFRGHRLAARYTQAIPLAQPLRLYHRCAHQTTSAKDRCTRWKTAVPTSSITTAAMVE
jgi:hypothetical protein